VLLAEPDAIGKHGMPVHFGKNKLVFNANDVYQSTHVFTTNELLNITLYTHVCHQEFSSLHKEGTILFHDSL